MNLIVIQPSQRGRVHAHEEREEVYLVLGGELTLFVEGTEHVLGPERSVRVGPAVRRQLVNAGPERLILLALGGSGGHVGRDGHAWTRGRQGARFITAGNSTAGRPTDRLSRDIEKLVTPVLERQTATK